MRLLPRARAAALACSLAGAVLASASVLVPAHATPASPTVPAAAAGHRAAVQARIVFTKNHDDPFRSTITWQVRQRGVLVEEQSWRAGSGFGGPGTQDSCRTNIGWLPDGRYAARQESDHHGNLIKGRVFRLSDKRCAHGTVRHQLYIHTETGAGNRQCPDRPGDQACRWEYPAINDYRSHGCIKMAPDDLAALTRDYLRWFGGGKRSPHGRFAVVVRG